MGGFGSGRPSGSGRGKVEACRSIDVNRLHREGCLRAGWSGSWQWTRDGERVAWISLRAEPARLHLTYRVRVNGGDWEDVAETVRIVRVGCRFGGVRPYFNCPGVVNGIACGRRVAKRYGPGRYFLCPDEAITRRALDLLGSRRNDAYEAALAVLREDTKDWWAEVLARDPDEIEEGEEPATADVEGLRRFLEGEVQDWFENREEGPGQPAI